MIWKTPIYRFRIPEDDNSESENLKEIVIDVTGSAPPFTEPSDVLKEVLQEIFKLDSFKKVETVTSPTAIIRSFLPWDFLEIVTCLPSGFLSPLRTFFEMGFSAIFKSSPK